MEFRMNVWGYENIIGARRYRNAEEAESDARANFSFWFPNADSRSQMFVFNSEYEKGKWTLQVNYMTADGPFATDIDFEDFRPIRRCDTAHAKLSMTLT